MGDPFTESDLDLLIALTRAIIPPDARDAGAAAVDAGPRLAARLRQGAAASLYDEGLRTARALCARQFQRPIAALTDDELHALMEQIAATVPAFFKQLRFDTTALYLSDPGVWARIGFPGPSIDQGGFQDFDRPQGITRKE
jgi:hypothetical protein